MPSRTFSRCLSTSGDSIDQQGNSSCINLLPKYSCRTSGPIVKNNLASVHNRATDMAPSSQKERNLLLNTPSVPELQGHSKLCLDSSDVSVTVPDNTSYTSSKQERRLATQVFASVAVSIGSMGIGFTAAYTSPALVSMEEANSSLTVTAQEASWIGSLMPLSALVGGLIGGALLELMGRKKTIVAVAIPFVISWLLIACAVNVYMIFAARVIAGLCVGIASLCLPVYIGETVQADVRGRLELVSTVLGNSGILICYIAGKFLNWWQLAILGGCIPLIFLVCVCFIPETPRWYISKGKLKEARKALQWLRGKNMDVGGELGEIESNHQVAEKSSSNTLWDVIHRDNVRPFLICIGLMFFQQMSGINAVIFYTVRIFKDAGSTVDENLCTIIVGFVNLAATLMATFLIDKLGRKKLLYTSSASMLVSLTALGSFFLLKDHFNIDVTNYGWLPLMSFIVFVIGFSLGFGPIPWLMMSEILPAKIRGPAASLTTAFNWTCTFIITKTFSDLLSIMGSFATFGMFAGFCFVSGIFVFFCVPETKGRTLEDIELKLKKNTFTKVPV